MTSKQERMLWGRLKEYGERIQSLEKVILESGIGLGLLERPERATAARGISRSIEEEQQEAGTLSP